MILNTGLEVISASFSSALLAQLLKIIFYFSIHRKINFKIITTTGGMPSSHSGFVVALMTSIGLISGFDSVDFALALGFAMIVMYDAAGLRRSAGKMATVLNKVVDEIYAYKRRPTHASEKLMELLGHTPLEVLMGGLLGASISLGFHALL
ncbi:MAG: divergent PAP2 family protein [Candidatus Gastranaerophilales bacterium]|nr:divergent PAP2 family protein [Candidatus Gastranaerophilales bacterium]